MATVIAGTRQGQWLRPSAQRLPLVKDQESTALVIDPDSRP